MKETALELLAPARNMEIGIAAIGCGADAVYIAGPKFGARKDAGNAMEDISQLCSHAHKFGAKIFVTLNTILYEDELQDASKALMDVQQAGADAIIVQDLSITRLARNLTDFNLPLHASTQCAIRTPEQAAWLESLGFSRLILERELSLEQIQAIRKATTCELEFFVHGALCVCYSGQCYMSQKIAGRSANRGACIQACRSRYDLIDRDGRVLVKDKALLSLKDYNLKERLEELSEAGITSFKIEGRLKNGSYVRNVVSDYSDSLDDIVKKNGGKYVREAFGRRTGGFAPDLSKTFNRGYTELFIDGKKGDWAAMDAAKSMGEYIGCVTRLSKGRNEVTVRLSDGKITLANGDGFSFVAADSTVVGFRGDVCSGNTIRCKSCEQLFVGARLFRNISTAFEKEIESHPGTRMIDVKVRICTGVKDGRFFISAAAESEDGRNVSTDFDAGDTPATNPERSRSMIVTQFQKTCGHYNFIVSEFTAAEQMPFVSASALNGIRRNLAGMLDKEQFKSRPLLKRSIADVPGRCPYTKASYRQNISNSISRSIYEAAGAEITGKAYELQEDPTAELMRTKYCIRHELGMCPKSGVGKSNPSTPVGRLFLLNNGRKFVLGFDCRNCEMTVSSETI